MEFETAAALVYSDLPWWARYAPFIDGPILALAVFVALSIVFAIGGRELRALSKDVHWTEVARASAPLSVPFWLTIIAAMGEVVYGHADPLGQQDGVGLALWRGAWVLVGAAVPFSLVSARTGGLRHGFPAAVRGWLIYVLGLRPGWLALPLTWIASRVLEPLDALIASALVVIALVACGRYVRPSWLAPLGLAAPADARLKAIVKRAAERLGLPVVPEAWVYRGPLSSPAAFASPPTALVVPTYFLRELGDVELEGLCVATAIGIERPPPGRSRGGVTAVALGLIGARDAIAGLGGPSVGSTLHVVGLVMLALSFVSSVRHGQLIVMPRINEIGGVSWLRALERLYELRRRVVVPATGKGVYDQLVEQGVTPAYPRPAKPETGGWAPVVGATMVAMSLILGARAGARDWAPYPAGIAMGSADAAGARADELAGVHTIYAARRGLASRRVAARFERRDRVHHLASLVRHYVVVNRCACANEAMVELESRVRQGATSDWDDLDGLGTAVDSCGE